jgi:hypothetical protein
MYLLFSFWNGQSTVLKTLNFDLSTDFVDLGTAIAIDPGFQALWR